MGEVENGKEIGIFEGIGRGHGSELSGILLARATGLHRKIEFPRTICPAFDCIGFRQTRQDFR